MKKELLEMKKRLIALTLVGTCSIGLTGCRGDNTKKEETKNNKTDIYYNVIVFDENSATIIPAFDTSAGVGLLGIFCNSSTNNESKIFVPIEDTLIIGKDTPYTAEEYIKALKGEDFPITYLNNQKEDNLSR